MTGSDCASSGSSWSTPRMPSSWSVTDAVAAVAAEHFLTVLPSSMLPGLHSYTPCCDSRCIGNGRWRASSSAPWAWRAWRRGWWRWTGSGPTRRSAASASAPVRCRAAPHSRRAAPAWTSCPRRRRRCAAVRGAGGCSAAPRASRCPAPPQVPRRRQPAPLQRCRYKQRRYASSRSQACCVHAAVTRTAPGASVRLRR
jgi:hypothetical protein